MKLKKIGIYLSICLSIILFLPSAPVLADAVIVPGYYTQESVNDYFSGSFNGNVDINTEAKRIYEALNNGISMEDLLNVNNIDFSSYSNGYSLIVTAYRDYVYFDILIHLPNYQYLPCILKAYDSSSVTVNWNYIEYPITNYNTMVYIDHYESRNGDLSSRTRYDMTRDWGSATYGYYEYRMAATLLYCTNIMGVYSGREAHSVQPSGNSFLGRTILDHIYHSVNNYEFTNYWSDSLPYFDGNNIVDPDNPISNEESNLNHLYFNSVDIGFCEPSGVNSYNSFGGAYFYIKYNVDEWIRSHINDYDLYFSSTAFAGSRQINGSVRVSLDADGCICVPFSDIFNESGGLISSGFVVATTNSKIEQNFYKSYLYSVSSDKLPALLNKFNTVDDNSLKGAWDSLLDVYFGNWLLAFTQGNSFTSVINSATMSTIQGLIEYYSNYKIQTQCYLIDKNDNRSGSVGRIFDLATGSDTSTDNQGLVNENPYIPDDDIISDSDYLPYVPDNNGVNNTSLGGVNQLVNFSVPSDIKLFLDNGLSEFVTWFNTAGDGEVATNYFWGTLLGTFKNNPATELYSEYFGFLPDSFKNLILACCGIGVVGAVFSILRHKL